LDNGFEGATRAADFSKDFFGRYGGFRSGEKDNSLGNWPPLPPRRQIPPSASARRPVPQPGAALFCQLLHNPSKRESSVSLRTLTSLPQLPSRSPVRRRQSMLPYTVHTVQEAVWVIPYLPFVRQVVLESQHIVAEQMPERRVQSRTQAASAVPSNWSSATVPVRCGRRRSPGWRRQRCFSGAYHRKTTVSAHSFADSSVSVLLARLRTRPRKKRWTRFT